MRGLLLSLSIFLLTLPYAFAAQVGIVTSAQAVIYADIELKSPIGYVKKNKQIAVGNVKRRRGEILPVVVNGQIGWVRVRDIRLPDEEREFDKSKKVTEHEVLIDEKVKDPLDQNNFVTLRTGPSGVKVAASGTETSIMFEHKNPYFSTHWGLGLEYFQGTLDVFKFKTVNIKGGLSYVPLRMSWASLEVYGNLVISGDFRVVSEEIGEYKGNMFGADYGVMLRLLPEYRVGIVVGGGMTYYKFLGLQDIEVAEGDNVFQVNSLSGTKFFAGLTLKF